jgi:hypothetical protein
VGEQREDLRDQRHITQYGPHGWPTGLLAPNGPPSPNATHLGRLGWSLAVLGLGGWGDYDRGVGWPAVLVTLSMVGSLDRKLLVFRLITRG